MAKVKKAVSKKVKKTTKPRKMKTSAPTNMVRFGLGLPKKCIVVHKYADICNLTSTLGALAIQRFSANGMYDPDITSTGHQPLYFDQFTPLYNHYIVIGSKISIEVCPQGNAEDSYLISLMINDDTSVPSGNINALAEQSNGRWKMIPAHTTDTIKMSRSWSAKKFFGGSVLANTNLQGTVSTNPAEQSYYDVGLQSTLGGNTVAVAIRVNIEYTAVWRELKEVAQS